MNNKRRTLNYLKKAFFDIIDSESEYLYVYDITKLMKREIENQFDNIDDVDIDVNELFKIINTVKQTVEEELTNIPLLYSVDKAYKLFENIDPSLKRCFETAAEFFGNEKIVPEDLDPISLAEIVINKSIHDELDNIIFKFKKIVRNI